MVVYSYNHNTGNLSLDSYAVGVESNLSRCPQKQKGAAYLSLIKPTLQYAASVWYTRDSIEAVRFIVKLLDLFMGINTGWGASPTKCGGPILCSMP